jgi:thioredoxin-related protein
MFPAMGILSLYITGNALRFRYKAQPVNAVRETVAVYCENQTEHTDTVRTPQETRYVSATEPNWLMLFGETVAVYCENHTEHTDTVRTSQETHYFSATEPNWLMLFGETIAVYCENHTEHTDTVRTSQETHYISATEPNWLMLFGETVAVCCENHTEQRDTPCVDRMRSFDMLKQVVHIVTMRFTFLIFCS